jgi:hypothetical protein
MNKQQQLAILNFTTSSPQDPQIQTVYITKVWIWKTWYAWSRCSQMLHYGQSNHSVLHICFIMYTKIYGYRWMTTGDGSSPSPAVLYICPHLSSKRRHRFRPTLGRTGQLNSLVGTSISFVWYGLGFSWWCLLSVGGWDAFLVVVIASSGRYDVVSGL